MACCCSPLAGLSLLLRGHLVRSETVLRNVGESAANPVLRHRICRGLSWRSIDDFYHPGTLIGSGAFGSVEVRQHILSLQQRAVKLIEWPAGLGVQEHREVEEAVLRELQALIVLDHPNVVKFREWFVEPAKGLFLVTEYYAGGDLEKWMKEVCEQPPEQRGARHASAQKTLHQVAYALSYLHACGVAHRDIKPGNVLLSGDDALLTDFGLASLPGGEVSAKPVGTMEFMAPELYREEPRGEACDVWALGIILVQLISAVERGLVLHPFVELDVDSTYLYVSLLKAYLSEEPWDREVIAEADESAHELLDAMLVYGERCAATFVMNHPWTQEGRHRQRLSSVTVGGNLRGWVNLPAIDKALLQINADFVPQSVHLRKLHEAFEDIDEARDGQLHDHELRSRVERERCCFRDGQLHDHELRSRVERERGGTEEDLSRPSSASGLRESPDRRSRVSKRSVGFGEFVAINVNEQDLLANGASEMCFDSLNKTNEPSKDEISVDDLANALGEDAEALEGLLGKGTVSKRDFTSLTEAALLKRSLGAAAAESNGHTHALRCFGAASPTITPSSQAASSFEPVILSPVVSPRA